MLKGLRFSIFLTPKPSDNPAGWIIALILILTLILTELRSVVRKGRESLPRAFGRGDIESAQTRVRRGRGRECRGRWKRATERERERQVLDAQLPVCTLPLRPKNLAQSLPRWFRSTNPSCLPLISTPRLQCCSSNALFVHFLRSCPQARSTTRAISSETYLRRLFVTASLAQVLSLDACLPRCMPMRRNVCSRAASKGGGSGEEHEGQREEGAGCGAAQGAGWAGEASGEQGLFKRSLPVTLIDSVGQHWSMTYLPATPDNLHSGRLVDGW